MNGENFNRPNAKLRVLVAPLDWGLGHATRCIPVISALIINGFEVIIAANGPSEALLRSEFPNLEFVLLDGYSIRYGKGSNLAFSILRQLPKVFGCIKREQQWLKRIVAEKRINVIISDNRPGLSHEKIHSLYITHQLLIKTGNRIISNLLQRLHYRYINKFSECWVPDAEGTINLAGDLSHPAILPTTQVRYLGPLSRFKQASVEKKYDILFLLSGPEPQRTIFEEKILGQLKNFSGKIALVRGLPGLSNTFALAENTNIEQYNHLPADQLNQLVQQSKLVICRSGYTTVMDLVKLQQPALLVPTPGQTEQEYLGKYLMQQKMFYSIQQKDFFLTDALKAANGFAFRVPQINEMYHDVIRQWAATL